MYRAFLTLLSLFAINASAAPSYQFYVGEESSYMWRTRDGGTKQSGRLDGVRVGADRIKPYGVYIGGDFIYASGKLKGETGRGAPQSSIITDEIAEGRIGFTFQNPSHHCPFFTPFMGWGYFKEINDFRPPSPLPITFTDTFNFCVVGFLSGVNLTPLLSMGVNFKVRFMQNAQSVVSDDPLYDDVTLLIDEETLYRLEVPLAFTPGNSFLGIGGALVPFYEFRHFGGREGYPFNFRDTKFNLVGLRFALIYRF